jgi:membrane protease YdiL (CAAX protease family)
MRVVSLAVLGICATVAIVQAMLMVVAFFLLLARDGLLNSYFLGTESIGNDAYIGYLSEAIGFVLLFSLPVGALWAFSLRGKKLLTSDLTRRNATPTVSAILILFALLMSVQFAVVLLQLALQPFMDLLNRSLTDSYDETAVSAALSPLGLLYVGVVGPIIEEIVFRGGIMRRLERHGANFAIVTSSLLFALYHMVLFQAFFAFFAGLLFAYAAGRFSLKWSVVLHMANNLLACAQILVIYYAPSVSTAVNLAMLFLYFACFVFSLAYLATHWDKLRAQKRAGASPLSQVFSNAYRSPVFIVIVTVFVLFMLGSIMVLA